MAKDLREKFKAESLASLWQALHEYLQTQDSASKLGKIALGDWVDLESLTIARTWSGYGTFHAESRTIANAVLGVHEHGTLLRLIMVGKNSFAPTNPGAPAHLVMQFQNLPFFLPMNATNTNTGGYARSDMRRFLREDFLPAFKAAARLPDTLLYAPTRFVANGGEHATGADKIADAVWLPTEWELFGETWHSNKTYENADNQARLAYYTSDSKRIKWIADEQYGEWYWEASPRSGSASNFCRAAPNGLAYNYVASAACGVAPAFCVA
jgi:hypothetical protein